MADYKFELTIPEANVPKMIEVFSMNYNATIGEDENGDPIPNPQTQTQFAQESLRFKVVQFIKSQEHAYDLKIAEELISGDSILD